MSWKCWFITYFTAYSIHVPSFNNLKIENSEMTIIGEPKREPFAIENYAWDIVPSERVWSGIMRPVKVNKSEIAVTSSRHEWNNILEKELVTDLNWEVKGKTKKEKVEKDKSKDKSKSQKKDKKSSKNVKKKWKN